jgi:hypothetical protein
MLCISYISCVADSLFVNVNSTPYDTQMTRIRPVLFSKHAAKQNLEPGQPLDRTSSCDSIRLLDGMEDPEEVETAPYADCKSKAVALSKRLN